MLKEDELLISAIGKFVVIISNSGDELEGNQNAFLADLLKNLHTLGKSGTNYFSTVKDYFAPLEDHPALNLKNHLVRLLGNLCYQNRAIQDRLRTEEVIPTLLECSQLDSRNKLIKEWSVQVIRHLCEDNLENQELIKSYVRVGVTQPPILEDLGLSVDVSDSGLKLHAAERENWKKIFPRHRPLLTAHVNGQPLFVNFNGMNWWGRLPLNALLLPFISWNLWRLPWWIMYTWFPRDIYPQIYIYI